MQPGVIVALFLSNWTLATKKMKPSIAKVTAVNENSIDIEYFRGDWNMEWRPWTLNGKKEHIWKDKEIPKSAIVLILNEFKDNKLTSKQKTFMRKRYLEIKDNLEQNKDLS